MLSCFLLCQLFPIQIEGKSCLIFMFQGELGAEYMLLMCIGPQRCFHFRNIHQELQLPDEIKNSCCLLVHSSQSALDIPPPYSSNIHLPPRHGYAILLKIFHKTYMFTYHPDILYLLCLYFSRYFIKHICSPAIQTYCICYVYKYTSQDIS